MSEYEPTDTDDLDDESRDPHRVFVIINDTQFLFAEAVNKSAIVQELRDLAEAIEDGTLDGDLAIVGVTD